MASRFSFVMIGPRVLPSNVGASAIAVLLFVLFFVTTGCIREEDVTLEQRAHQLAGELMCPVCDGQTIDGSNAQIAQDMRLKVRDLLDGGSTNAEVKDYFVIRYGQEILAAPSRSGFNLLAWIMPVIIVLGGIGIALITIKNMRKAGQQAQSLNDQRQFLQNDLADYLAQVDRDLVISSKLNPNDGVDQTTGTGESEAVKS
ncbi:MAG: cytochrome c-type biogenesis protein CcmH [Chloroflexi bacterium]|nr:cytochrome c-type biogenesis protein CcmH [Chloroflexota bacterium]